MLKLNTVKGKIENPIIFNCVRMISNSCRLHFMTKLKL